MEDRAAKPVTVRHACDPSTRKAEVQGPPGLQSETLPQKNKEGAKNSDHLGGACRSKHFPVACDPEGCLQLPQRQNCLGHMESPRVGASPLHVAVWCPGQLCP